MHCVPAGEFSRRVHALTEQLISLRIYVEAAIDFPEEEIDFLADGHVLGLLEKYAQNYPQCSAKLPKAPCCATA